MKRSTGVTVIAVLAMIGSVLTLLMGLLMGVILFFVPIPAQQPPASPMFFKSILIMSVLMYLLPAIWGIITSVGLLRLRSWARISVIVFSVLLGLSSCFGGLVILVMPAVPNPGGSQQAEMFAARLILALFSVSLLATAVWWIVFFNRPGVKNQFGRPAESRDARDAAAALAPGSSVTGRPLSITIIAWMMLVGCACLPLGLLVHSPAIAFTVILTGWKANLLYAFYAVLNLVVGLGLLRLQSSARLGAIAIYLLGALNIGVFYFAPGGKGRIQALMTIRSSMFPWTAAMPTGAYSMDLSPFLILGGMVGVLAMAVPLYFLITRKKAFEQIDARA